MRLQSYIAAGIGDYVIMLVGEALLGGTTLVREYKLWMNEFIESRSQEQSIVYNK